jgi:hypothetical protein
MKSIVTLVAFVALVAIVTLVAERTIWQKWYQIMTIQSAFGNVLR